MATDYKSALVTTATWNSWTQSQRDQYPGGQYTLINSWVAALQTRDIVANNENNVLEVYDDFGTGLYEKAVISGFISSATNRVIIRPAAGEEQPGSKTLGFRLWHDQVWSNVLELQSRYVDIFTIRVELASGGGRTIDSTQNSNWENVIHGCVVTGGNETIYISRAQVCNCLLHDCTGKAISSPAWYGYESYNNVFENNNTAVSAGATDTSKGSGISLSNSAFYNNTTDIDAGLNFYAADTNTNATSGAVAPPGAGSLTGITSADFVDAAGGDFHITTSSALHQAGTDLSAFFTKDIDGDLWVVPWSIGFDQPQAGGGGVSISVSDISSVIDSLQSSASISSLDIGAGKDDSAPPSGIALAIADKAKAIGSILQTSLISVIETATVADSLQGIPVTFSIADSAKIAEVIASDASFNLSDYGFSAEIITKVIGGLVVSISDTSFASDNTSIVSGQQVSDLASGVSSIKGLSVALGLTDNGFSIDLISKTVAGLLISIHDKGKTTESATLIGVQQILETAKGFENINNLAGLGIADSGTGAESLSIFSGNLVVIADLVSGKEAIISVAVSSSVIDSGEGNETANLSFNLSLSDVSLALDAIDIVKTFIISISEAVSGVEGVGISGVNITISDIGLGQDSPSLNYVLQIIEQAGGTDVVVTTAGTPAVISVDFTLPARKTSFILPARGRITIN